MKAKVKVGDLVHVRPHIAGSRSWGSPKMLLADGATGVIISRLSGNGYYDVMLSNGKVIFTAYANLEIISHAATSN